ncbi:MAG: YdcF family protein [Chloroflexi bacterium]|nr:YdcF family protein [Chloroflexota bacterium]
MAESARRGISVDESTSAPTPTARCPRPRRRLLWWVAGLALFLAIAVAAHPIWLQALGDALVLREAPVAADAVVVLGGNSEERAIHGAELVRAGYAPRLYVIDERIYSHAYEARWSDFWRRGEVKELERWVPHDAVVVLFDQTEPPAGTYEEARQTWEQLEPLGVKRVLIVTDEFHSRRAASTWRSVVGDRAQVISTPVATEHYRIRLWWRNRPSLKAIGEEYIKWAIYLTTGRI